MSDQHHPRLHHLRSTPQLLRQASASFFSNLLTFLFLSLLIFSFRTVVENGTHLLTAFIDRDPSLKSLLSRLDVAANPTSSSRSPQPSPVTLRRRHRPFLQLTRVGTLDEDFFSGEDDDDSRALFGKAPIFIFSHFTSKLGFNGTRVSDMARSGISLSLSPSLSHSLYNPTPQFGFSRKQRPKFSVKLRKMKVMEEVVEENEVKPLTAEELEQYESVSESSDSDDGLEDEEEDGDEDEDDDDDDDADDDDDDDDEDEDDDDDVQEVVQSSGGPPVQSIDDDDDEDEEDEEGAEGGDDDDDGEGDDDDDDDDGEGEDEDDIGTEYLVRPVARAEDEEDASDFEPEENGEDEDVEEEEDDDDDTGGKVEAPPKRKRSDKDDSDDDDDGGEDDVRPSKR